MSEGFCKKAVIGILSHILWNTSNRNNEGDAIAACSRFVHPVSAVNERMLQMEDGV